MKLSIGALIATIICAACANAATRQANDAPAASLRTVVDDSIRPLMLRYHIPGMAVAVTVAGKIYVFDYGVTSTNTRQSVTRDTLFEIGSVSKTFTATLASWADVNHQLSLSDKTARYLPSLQGTPFGNVSLLNLGTHTPGGLPLQVPDDVTNDDELMLYLKQWRPAYPPGTYRTYSNPGIGMLGLITAKSMGQDFNVLIDQQLFPALGMKNSFIKVPAARMADYAQGYTEEDAPVRMSAGVLSSEAYGVKSTAADLIRFVEANLSQIQLSGSLQRAVTQTHTGYFQAGPMTQDLIWEQYPYPVTLNKLLEGNSRAMIYKPNPVSEITPPQEPQKNTWINKTGSTNGFGAYVAFVPEKQLGIVILGNKSFPIADRVTAAYKILTTEDASHDR